MSALPTSRHFVTQLLNSLPSSRGATDDDAGTNPLSVLDETAKKHVLSLQVLFPNEFLPALDLLDRGLVTRFSIGDIQKEDATKTECHTVQGEVNVEAQSENTPMLDTTDTSSHTVDARPLNSIERTVDHPTKDTSSTSFDTVYYVRSAQQRSSRYSTSYDTTTSYEVRLLAWNCSCPTFTFAAFPGSIPPVQYIGDDPTNAQDPDWKMAEQAATEWMFGGVSLGCAMPPVCKHLLACVLVERCKGLFGRFAEERLVSVEEAAGWAAGWGDS